jgi:hypothetical protein
MGYETGDVDLELSDRFSAVSIICLTDKDDLDRAHVRVTQFRGIFQGYFSGSIGDSIPNIFRIYLASLIVAKLPKSLKWAQRNSVLNKIKPQTEVLSFDMLYQDSHRYLDCHGDCRTVKKLALPSNPLSHLRGTYLEIKRSNEGVTSQRELRLGLGLFRLEQELKPFNLKIWGLF